MRNWEEMWYGMKRQAPEGGMDSEEHPKLAASPGGVYTELAAWYNVVPVNFD